MGGATISIIVTVCILVAIVVGLLLYYYRCDLFKAGCDKCKWNIIWTAKCPASPSPSPSPSTIPSPSPSPFPSTSPISFSGPTVISYYGYSEGGYGSDLSILTNSSGTLTRPHLLDSSLGNSTLDFTYTISSPTNLIFTFLPSNQTRQFSFNASGITDIRTGKFYSVSTGGVP